MTVGEPNRRICISCLLFLLIYIIKFSIEMVNVLKKQQPDHRAENNRRPPMVLQHSEKIPLAEAYFCWPLNKNVYLFSDYGCPKYINEVELKIIHVRVIEVRGSWLETGVKCGGFKHILWDLNPPLYLYPM